MARTEQRPSSIDVIRNLAQDNIYLLTTGHDIASSINFIPTPFQYKLPSEERVIRGGGQGLGGWSDLLDGRESQSNLPMTLVQAIGIRSHPSGLI